MNYTDEFNALWPLYPKRAGGNSKAKAFRQYQARLKQGANESLMHVGAIAYLEFCEATGKIRTEYVMQAATFFGRDEHYLESWDLPIETKKESLADKAKRLKIEPQRGESQFSYDDRVRNS